MPEPSVLSPGTAIAGPPRPRIRRRSRQQGRAQRWDARPVLTARDAAALRFIGEQYAVRDDVLAVLLGRLSPAKPQASGMLGPRTLRQRLGRWQQAGWVERRRHARPHLGAADPGRPAAGRAGVRPVGAGRVAAGPPPRGRARPPAPRGRCPARAVGCASGSCGAAAARRAGTWPTAPCPRRSRRAGRGSSEAWELVEVELTQKARPRVVAALKTRPPHTAAITYYVPAALHAPLSAQLASVVRELGGRPEVAVEPLPAGARRHLPAGRG